MSRYLGDNIRIEPCPNSVLFLDPGWIRGDPGRVLLNPSYPKVDPGFFDKYERERERKLSRVYSG